MVPRRARTSCLAVALAVAFFALVGRPSPAQVPVGRGSIDLECAAECQKEYGRGAGIAEGILQRRGYSYSASSTNCSTAWDSTRYQCAVDHEVCTSRCALSDAACKSPCSAAFQACCYTTALGNADHYRAECLKGCARRTAAEAATQAGMTPRETVALAQEAMESLRTDAEKASDEALRQKAFEEARAKLVEKRAAFALLVGGAGRLWIVRADGAPVLLSRANRDLLRRGAPADPEKAVQGLLAQADLGLSGAEARNIVNALQQWPMVTGTQMTAELKAGDGLYFPPGEMAPEELRRAIGSSEHASIRGTINGGGDFI